MKKYLQYILILVMLVGFISPITVAYGADLFDPTNPSGSGSTVSSSSGFSLMCKFDNPNPKLQNLFSYATCIINSSVIPLIFALAVAMFVWGVVQFVINNNEEAKKAKGKQFMIWGIIALTVMVSVWGMVKILGNTFGIDYVIPQVSPTTPVKP